MCESFTNFWSFTYHVGKELIVNGKDIYSEINTAIGDYKSGNFNQMGYEVGSALF